ncbi:hypothetical protein OG239_18700 [Streptomyces sp. NBC_00868]|nr:hypothetical protein OG239_18700 [Streptomyces sp. NBC_00868]
MADFTPEQMRRMHISLTMVSPTAPRRLNVVRLRRQIESQTPSTPVMS